MSIIRKSYTAEFKAKVVREILKEEKSLSQIASEYATHVNVISRWRDQVLQAMPGIFDEKSAQEQSAKEAAWEQEREGLYAEIGKLSTGLPWLKKNVVPCLGREERKQLIDWGMSELSISVQAQLLGLNRTGLYYQPRPPLPQEIAIKHRIDELYTAHPYFGSRRISEQLKREGLPINRKAVRRHMQEMGLCAVFPGPNLSKRAHRAAIYPYLLTNIKALAPNHVWGLDITYIRLRHGWLYLVAVLDWYSRYIVSWELDQTTQTAFVVEAMQRALNLARPTICNSDQGSQFTSSAYLDLLKAHEVQISMDGRGRALDNVFTERLWRTIKYEEVYLKDYQSPREARHNLAAYLQFYNERRLHQSLDYQTPAELYFK